MGSVIESVFTGVGSLISGKSPKTDTSVATATVDEAKKNAKKSRQQALATMGGVSGEELTGSQVSKGGETLFGN